MATPRAIPTLIADVAAISPDGSFDLAVRFRIAPDWHLYWNGLNDTGFAPKVRLTLPQGLAAGDIAWPLPERHVSEGDILDHIYEREVLLLIPITVAADAHPGVHEVVADLKWLVCSDVCLPESAQVRMTLRISEPGAPPTPSADRAAIAATRLALPSPLADAKRASSAQAEARIEAKIEGGSLVVAAPGATRLAFFPAADSADFTDLVHRGEVAGDRLILPLAAASGRVRGLLSVRAKDGRSTGYSLDLPISP